MRVLLIDDHALFRIGLRELLERRDIDVIDAVGDCEEGIRKARELNPDVVLLDMRMPKMSGIDVLRALQKGDTGMPIVMLTTSTDERDLVESLRNGAQGYLLKDMEPDELIDALQQIVQGNTVVAKELTAVLAKAVQGEVAPSAPSHRALAELTPRARLIDSAHVIRSKIVAV